MYINIIVVKYTVGCVMYFILLIYNDIISTLKT